MPSCSADGCFNCRTKKKKIRMFRFPADPFRRKQWEDAVNRADWSPGPSAVLCQNHFEADQYEEHRKDGWKKLKQTAVPTVFHDCVLPKPSKVIKLSHLQASTIIQSIRGDHSYAKCGSVGVRADVVTAEIKQEVQDTNSSELNEAEQNNLLFDLATNTWNKSPSVNKRGGSPDHKESFTAWMIKEEQPDNLITPATASVEGDVEVVKEEIPDIGWTSLPEVGECEAERNIVKEEVMDTVRSSLPEAGEVKAEGNILISNTPPDIGANLTLAAELPSQVVDVEQEQKEQIAFLKAEVHALRKELRKRKARYETFNQNIRKLFNPDQIEALSCTSTQGHRWSQDTLRKAAQMRHTCANRGYQSLLDMGHPLPSIKTLQREKGQTKTLSGETTETDGNCKMLLPSISAEYEDGGNNDRVSDDSTFSMKHKVLTECDEGIKGQVNESPSLLTTEYCMENRDQVRSDSSSLSNIKEETEYIVNDSLPESESVEYREETRNSSLRVREARIASREVVQLEDFLPCVII